MSKNIRAKKLLIAFAACLVAHISLPRVQVWYETTASMPISDESVIFARLDLLLFLCLLLVGLCLAQSLRNFE